MSNESIEHRILHPWLRQRKEEGAHLTTDEHVGLNGRIAVFVTRRFGSMGMFWALIAWMLIWMLLASVGVPLFKKDPYPFVFLLFLSNLVQLFALPILAVGQQVLSRASDKQALQTFKDAEALLELQTAIHELIEVNNRMTEEIHSRVVKSDLEQNP